MNLRPPGYEPDELPTALPRDIIELSVAISYALMIILFRTIQPFDGAGDRGRTGTIGKDRRILSPVRLPIPPLRQNMAPRVGLEPTAYRLTAGCSTIELSRNTSYHHRLLLSATSYIIHISQSFVNHYFP